MLTVLTSGKSAPGTTTLTIALGLLWPKPVVMADCDPAGGDIAPGLLPGRAEVSHTLLTWATQTRNEPALTAAAALAEHCVRIPEARDAWLLPGLPNEQQNPYFTPDVWARLALSLEHSSAALGRDTLLDIGRLTQQHTPWPILRTADQILLVVRPTLRSVHHAGSAVLALGERLGDLDNVRLVVTGAGPYTPGEVAAALEVNLLTSIPEDLSTARALTDGATATLTTRKSRLLRSAAELASTLAAGGSKHTQSEIDAANLHATNVFGTVGSDHRD